tara:strand:+ start:4157 stop:6457 length:2301 start_codon:yes stop_codon:yes gene_type:complete
MALTATSNYKNALDANIEEEWLFELRNNNYPAPTDPQPADTSGFVIRLGTNEVAHGSISDMNYHGFILNKPTLRESIDLASSTAKIGNISITCANQTLSNHSKKLSAEIYGGSNTYLNHQVIVYSRVGGNSLKIFDGRLKDVKMDNADTVTLTLAVNNPLDVISIPELQSKAGNYYPVFYGTGSPETSTVSSPGFIDAARVFPVQVDSLNNDTYNCLLHKAVTDGRLHYPVKDQYDETNFPIFVPMDEANNTSTTTYEGETNSNKNVITTDLDLERSYLIRPQTVTDPSTVASSGSGLGLVISNSGNAYDATGSGTSATFSFQSDASETLQGTYIMTDFPKEDHAISELKFRFTHQVSAFQERDGDLTITLRALAFWSNSSSFQQVQYTSTQATTTSTFDLLNTSLFSTSLGTMPDKIHLLISFNNSPLDPGGGTSDDFNTATLLIKDMFLEVTTKIDPPVNSDGVAEKLSKIGAVTNVKKLYTGADGLDKSFSSGVVTNILDMHRDLLYRFGGVTSTPVVNNNNPDGTAKPYSNLETDRTNWFCKYYTNKPVQLNSLLKQCQFEGGFIHRFRPNDSASQYIYIDDSMTTTHFIRKEDLSNISVSVTPIESLVTKRIIKYEVNPINDKTFENKTCTDTSNNPRTKYNLTSNTKENIKTTELKILRNKVGDTNMGSTRNNGFANYYNAIEGVPKLIINADIINPGDSSEARNSGSSYFYLMEVGDICEIDDSYQLIAPFGDSFDQKQFILTSITRGAGSLKVVLREI